MAKNNQYNGLGFPVILLGVKTKKTPFGEALDIDHEKLRRTVFRALIEKPGRFSGAEVKFIRHEMGMSQEIFADLVSSERSSVAKWEKKDLALTKMAESAEILIRIEMSNFVSKRDLNRLYDKVRKSVRKEQQEMIEISA